MNAVDLGTELHRALADVRLLEHPFYQRWQNGELTTGELTAYAEQYRHFEAALPGILRSIVSRLPEGSARTFIEQNLADETGSPSHLELFDGFLTSVGGDSTTAAGPAVTNLLDTYASLVEEGPARNIAGLVAYEIQAPAIALTKGEGLRKHYGLEAHETVFWDVHAELDLDHGDWAVEALAETADSAAEVIPAAHRVGQAWWEFLDERQAASAGNC